MDTNQLLDAARTITKVRADLQALRDKGQAEWDAMAHDDRQGEEARQFDSLLTNLEGSIQWLGRALCFLPRVIDDPS
jgi:hypothetical protein